MRSTFSLLPYINRSKVKADGTTAVLCRITIDGKQTVISPGIYCRPEDWNGRKNEIKSARENNRLREYLRLMEEAYNEILKSQGVVSAEMLKNHITLNNIHPTTLLQMGEWERERLKKHSEEIDSTSSYRSSMYYQKYLTNYLMSLGKKDIGLEGHGRLRQSLQSVFEEMQEFRGFPNQPLPALVEPPAVSCSR